METLAKIWTAIRHNQATIIAAVLSVALIVWIYGCESKAESPLTGKKVNAATIDVDVQTYVAEREAQDKAFAAKANLAYDEISKQDELKRAVLDLFKQYAATTPVGAVATPVLSLLTAGLFISNRKKDSIIVTKSNALDAINKPAE